MSEAEVEETFEEPQTKLPITSSLEPCKSKFFTGDHAGFINDLTNSKFRIYRADYKYNDDYEGRPVFVVNNLMNGFIKQLEDKRKYLFVALKYLKTDDKYSITSTWVTNCTLEMPEIVPEKYDDFNWTECQLSELPNMMDGFTKKDNENIFYLH